ncbi:MAG: hypothetical protein ABJB86_16375 [Bacteroidota bacterium]
MVLHTFFDLCLLMRSRPIKATLHQNIAMCYEFAHPCDDRIIKKIGVIGALRYFMVCIGSLNYFYSDNAEVVEKVRVLLFVEHVALHVLKENEFYETLLVPETIAFQKFHGSKELYLQFVERNKAA